MAQKAAMLSPLVQLRAYQLDAVQNVMDAGRGGLVHIPCGAGKTLISMMCALRRGASALFICNTNEVAHQFAEHFASYTDTVSVSVIAGTRRDAPPEEDGVVITTYSMLATPSSRCAALLADIRGRRWHTLVLDEVHCAAADGFSRAWQGLHVDLCLGFTATLVRADNGIEELQETIGPVLFSIAWRQLEPDFTAPVDPFLVTCDTPPPPWPSELQKLAQVVSPWKLAVMDALFKRHADCKMLVFCDKKWACRLLAVRYMCPFLTGDTLDDERELVLENFRGTEMFQALFVSRIGDTGWDLPAVSVGITVDAHFGSKRQAAQRLGRLMRPKKVRSLYYDLIADDAYCRAHAEKRCAFLEDELGYTVTRLNASSIAPAPTSADCLCEELLTILHSDEEVSEKRARADEKRQDRAKVAASHPLFKKRALNAFNQKYKA